MSYYGTPEEQADKIKNQIIKETAVEGAKSIAETGADIAITTAKDAPKGLAVDKFLLGRPIGQLGEKILAEPASGFWGNALNSTKAFARNTGRYINAFSPSGGGFYGASMLAAPFEMVDRANRAQAYYDYYEGASNQNKYDKLMQETGSFPYMRAFWDSTKNRWRPAAEGFINAGTFGVYDVANSLVNNKNQEQQGE